MKHPEQPTIEELNEIFISACRYQQSGLLDAAREGYLRLLGWFDKAPMLHYNLGLVFFEQGDFRQALQCFEKGVQLSPDDQDLLFNLALARKNCGDREGAVETYSDLLGKNPMAVDVLYNLGGCYRELGDLQSASNCYKKVLTIDPRYSAANNNLAYVLHLQGKTEEAALHFQKVVENRPDHQAAGHMLAALTGKAVESSPEEYVVEVFDNYADHYEQSLVDELGYSVPARIRSMVKAHLVDQGDSLKKFHRGLDLGCGTGLSGQPFADIVLLLDGVDLSGNMIEQAKQKNIYNSLAVDSIESFLLGSRTSYDFFLAADVFGYIGELQQTMELLMEVAEPDALLCFSTESHDGDTFILRQSGRFAHSADYVRSVALRCNWKTLQKKSIPLRRDRGDWLQGDLWLLAVNA
jgi:predicted TPR repeat methyltransferase